MGRSRTVRKAPAVATAAASYNNPVALVCCDWCGLTHFSRMHSRIRVVIGASVFLLGNVACRHVAPAVSAELVHPLSGESRGPTSSRPLKYIAVPRDVLGTYYRYSLWDRETLTLDANGSFEWHLQTDLGTMASAGGTFELEDGAVVHLHPTSVSPPELKFVSRRYYAKWRQSRLCLLSAGQVDRFMRPRQGSDGRDESAYFFIRDDVEGSSDAENDRE